MKRPTDVRRMYPPGIPTKRDAWDRHGGWILAVFLLIALSTVIPW